MRVISQDRGDTRYSFDYDSTVFRLSDNMIYAVLPNRDYLIGHYKSSDRSKKVFEEMISCDKTTYTLPEE